MAGHSKWSNIKRTKEAQDKKRSSLFTKLSKDITTAAKLGENGDPNFNAMLKIAVDKARGANMPNEKIEKAINKGLGVSDSNEVVFENTYEFYGPNGTAFIVDCETDNTNRLLTELKVLANKIGLKMASEGSISWQFKEIGLVILDLEKENNLDDIMLKIFEFDGVIDSQIDNKKIEILTEKSSLKDIINAIKKIMPNIKIEKAELVKVTENTIEIGEPDFEKVNKIYEKLNEVEDVSNIWTNF